ncbi:short-chain dehydrogenase [Penicillium capsulatum]|uniref:Short-chain dehydrogenase n=1 Tax=Penicillium capsulatum TaxID=69766 RepID=A0A9W9IML4_9EURO|nr:short-chain dehydrogenase [Penicillium capsulatum]KAJ6121717.1 short-chain dehydrogenase [Penicillium capsulatum]
MSSPTTPVWFITAASSGFGYELAKTALNKGHRVIATARNPTKIQDLQEQGAETMALDVTDPIPIVEKIAQDAMQKYGRVDYLINAAGYILDGAVEESTAEEVQHQFNVNVFGTVNTIRAFLPFLRTQPMAAPDRPRATIATFGSLASWKGGPSYAFYSMTKACMSSLAESLHDELRPFGITATVIEPGFFRTGFLKSGARVSTQTRLPAYEDEKTPSAQLRKNLVVFNGKQLGDVKKGADAIFAVLTTSGPAEGKDLPVRVILGSDCESMLRDKCQSTVNLLDTWGSLARSTDSRE